MDYCQYGTEKKPGAPTLFIIDDNPLCFLFGLNGFLCKVGKVVIAAAEGKKPIKTFIRGQLKQILQDVLQGEYVITSGFCNNPPPAVPADITPSDVAAWLLSLADPTGFLPSGELPNKIKDLWRIQKFQDHCQCKPAVPYEPPIDPILPDPDGTQPPPPPPSGLTCAENTARANAGAARGAWRDMQQQKETKAYWAGIRAEFCPNNHDLNDTYTPPAFITTYRYSDYTVFEYRYPRTGITIETCVNRDTGYLNSFAVYVCNNLLTPPNPNPYPYFATVDEPDFDFFTFCLENPLSPFCKKKDKKCCCTDHYTWRKNGLWLS